MSLSSLKKITIVTDTLVASAVLELDYFHAQVSKEFGSLTKASSTYLRRSGRHVSNDCYAGLRKCIYMLAFYLIRTYLLGVRNKKQAAFFVYKLRLKSYIALSSYLLRG